jgi:hypothetical protein
MGVLLTFLPGLASNCDPPDLHFPSNWNYRCESLHPALFNVFGVSDTEVDSSWGRKPKEVCSCPQDAFKTLTGSLRSKTNADEVIRKS